MLKLLLILFFIPFLICVVLRVLFYKPSKTLEGKKSQLTTEKLLRALLPATNIEPSQKKKIKVHEGTFFLPSKHAGSKEIPLQLEALESAGLLLLARGKERALRQHASLLQFETLFPIFSLIIILFGFLARSFTLNLSLILFIIATGMTALNNLYLTWLRYQSFKLIKGKLKEIPLYVKAQDVEILEKELASRPYKYVLPRIFRGIL